MCCAGSTSCSTARRQRLDGTYSTAEEQQHPQVEIQLTGSYVYSSGYVYSYCTVILYSYTVIHVYSYTILFTLYSLGADASAETVYCIAILIQCIVYRIG